MAFDQSENFDDLVLVSSEEKEAECTRESEDVEKMTVDVDAEEGDMSVFIEPAAQSEIIEQFV